MGTANQDHVPLWRTLVMGHSLTRTIARACALVLVAAIVFGYVLLPVRTQGVSMLPTYRSGALILVNTLAYRWRLPERGDVVAIRMAGWRVMYIKRIIGLPGERIEVVGGRVLVDGRPLEERYVRHRAAWMVPEALLGPDDYFVVGDNRGMAQEQHEFGTVPRERIVGRLLF